ncbi:universal stress protein [Nocardioides zeae]|uniref:Universal stress protein n=1 Tax=Nocardioides imazamoxiresistens TaxID=3231893 RepID=A0ABU3PS13_9ACTN|nr:universal stress protein [Nocardioides zeae]MDT9591570.1 universal stress protein [Nocardioides zeae]
MNAPVAVLHAPSDAGSAALLSAARIAHDKDAELVVVATTSGVDDDRSEEVEREVATAQVQAVLGADVAWRLQLVRPGADAAEMLVGAVEALEPRVLVVGSRQRTTLGKVLLGRTLQRLLLEVSVPVLVVKADRPVPATAL